MNDGPATALAAVLLANSTSTLPDDVWDDDSKSKTTAVSKDRKPAPGVGIAADSGVVATSGSSAGAGGGLDPRPQLQGAEFGSMGVVSGHVVPSVGGADAVGNTTPLDAGPGPVPGSAPLAASAGPDMAQPIDIPAAPGPAPPSPNGGTRSPPSQVGATRQLTARSSNASLAPATSQPVASASGVRLVTVGAAGPAVASHQGMAEAESESAQRFGTGRQT